MVAKRHERTHARRAAISLLYTSEITEEGATKIADEGRFLTEEGSLPEYAHQLVRGVEAHRVAIDKHLVATSENWALARMPIVDRSILRLATYEMIYVDDVPTSVAINEAVELAKDFGGEDESPRFVNGILGRIAKLLEAKVEPSAAAREALSMVPGAQEVAKNASGAAREAESSTPENNAQAGIKPAVEMGSGSEDFSVLASAPEAKEAPHGA